MQKHIFDHQRQWSIVGVDEARELFVGYADQLGLDAERFAADLATGTYRDAVMADHETALALELPGTPTFFINGQLFEAPLSYFWLDAFVRLTLLDQEQYATPPDMVIDADKQYQAVIQTEKGDILLALDAEKAPITVNNFVFLAREGWYDGVTFFRVLPGFVAQSGDPTGTGLGGPGYELPAEIGLRHAPGAVAMARRSDQANPQRMSSGSQFYIALEALPQLDGAYTVFGKVVEGMDVALSLTARDPSQDPELPPGDEIITITIKELPE